MWEGPFSGPDLGTGKEMVNTHKEPLMHPTHSTRTGFYLVPIPQKHHTLLLAGIVSRAGPVDMKHLGSL